MKRLPNAVAAIVLLSGVSACNGIQSAPQAGAAGAVTQNSRAFSATFSRNAVYVSDQLEKGIVAFRSSEHAKNPSPLESLLLGVIPEGVWVDRDGVLYVAVSSADETQPGSVQEFKPGASQPFRTITDGIGQPSFIVVDHKGTLYVDQTYDASVEILEYHKGGTSPFATLSITEKGEGEGGPMTLDSQGNLYIHTSFIDNQPSRVYKFAPGSSKPYDLKLSGLNGTTGLSGDEAGNLYVADANGGISVYAPGRRTPTREILPPKGNIFDDFITTRSGALYAAQGADGYDQPSLLEYAPGGSQPVNVLTGYLHGPLIPALRAAAF